MSYGFPLIVFFLLFAHIQCKRSGEEITDLLYQHSDECRDPPDGGVWAPLADGESCGPPGHECKYPNEWCSAKSSSKSVPQFNCVKLPEKCRKALEEEKPDKSTIPPTSAAPNATTEAISTTTEASKEVEEATTESKVETTTADGESSSSEEAEPPKRPRPRVKGGPGGGFNRKTHDARSKGGAASAVPAPAPAPAPACRDGHPLCCLWATDFQPGGTQCNRNAAWMRVTCQKSCGTCGCTTSTYQTCRVNVNVKGCPYLGSSGGFLHVPVANQGNPFSFPTAGGSRGRLNVPVGGGQGQIVRSGPSSVSLRAGPNVNSVPVGGNQVFVGRGPVVVRAG